MTENLHIRYLPENIYPMASHHKNEIERHFRLRSEIGTLNLHASLKNVQVVFLCFTNRVGSNYLTDLLSLAGYGVRVAEEDYNSSSAIAASNRYQIKDYDAYLDHVVKATKRNGTCIWKIGPPQLLWLCNRGFIPDFFPEAKYIFMRRKDKTAQAVSLYIANKTGKYLNDASVNEVVLQFDKTEIARQLLHIFSGESHLKYFFTLHNVIAHELWYEDLIANPQSTILQISQWLGCVGKPWLDVLGPVDESRSLVKRQQSGAKDLLVEQMRKAFMLETQC